MHPPPAGSAGPFRQPRLLWHGPELADRTFFLLCHSSSHKVPLWVGYELKPEHLHRRAARPSHFRHDRELAGAGSVDNDYKHSEFSRGHMAPATDFAWSD